MKKVKYNRLIRQKSPYLLQHAANPVDWYPWGEEAFEAARKQDKPIFLSIGYSTCHWCHVMEHESFEDSTVAALMNDAFINIKVDREERPDIDDVYMTVCQMLTGSGGWPLTIIMTPDKKPFFAATYIPKERRYNRYGMLDLIPQIKAAWQNDRQKILASTTKIHEALDQVAGAPAGEELGEAGLKLAYDELKERFDAANGGFGQRPKFPSAHNLMFLLRYHQRSQEPQALQMVETTLQKMRMGGVYDHVGFGFHRYSTDERWLVPHFEKMLYDQAMLAMAYTEAFQLTGKPEYRQTAREIFGYVLRDMTDEAGGFYSAEDADSEGKEGKFYLWERAEVVKILGPGEGELFCRILNIEEGGNFEDEATRTRSGENIPHLLKALPALAKDFGMSEKALADHLEAARQKLFEEREKRVHPLKDDKVLADWNGLMIAALSKAAQAFDDPAYARAAGGAADFILNHMRDKNGRLLHRYRQGEVVLPAYLDDYAFSIWGFLELYEATFQVEYLQAAQDFTAILNQHFWDAQQGAYFFSADDGEPLLVRKKQIYDGAIPSGNSVMALNLLRLGRITGDAALEERAAAIGKAFSEEVGRYPAGYTMLMSAVDFAVGPSFEVVVTGKPGAEDTRLMLGDIQKRFFPNKILLLRPAGEDEPPISRIAPFTRPMSAQNGQATAYVCRNYACELPTTDSQKMLSLLQGKH